MTPKLIGLVGFNDVTALHLIGPADAFLAAALDDGYGGRIRCYEVCTIGAQSASFRTESGLAFNAAADLASAPDCDTIIIAGGAGLDDDTTVEQIADWLLHRSTSTRRIGAVGSGVLALASTGLLNGCEVSSHWRIARTLAQRFPGLKIDHKKPLARSGRYYTCNGLSGGINLALAMIQEDYGPYAARSGAQELALSLSPQSQVPTTDTPTLNNTTDRFADLIAWIMRNLHADLSVDVLARRACMCPDRFSKAFKSVFGTPPSDFVENLRLNEAHRRLSKRQKTVQSVATSLGFANAGAFQRAFARRFGKRPSRMLHDRRITSMSTPAKLAASASDPLLAVSSSS
jgi:transcriptional regulator GlxA family with amidase domain